MTSDVGAVATHGGEAAPGALLRPHRALSRRRALPVILGVVVVTELPETRETLFLRLMGAGKTLQRALAELKSLPPDAPERVIAEPVLLRYRLEVPSDPAQRTSDDEEFLLSTYDIVEVWKREQREEGGHLALQKVVTDIYEARFGAMPAELAAVVRETRAEDVLRGVAKLIATGSAEEVRERLLAGRTS